MKNAVETLKKNVELLVEEFSSINKSYSSIQRDLYDLERENRNLRERLRTLEKALELSRNDASIIEKNESNKKTKYRIDILVKEVEACIKALSLSS